MTEISLFGDDGIVWGYREFDGHPVLTATVNGVLHYEAAGLCKLTEHTNPTKALRDLVAEAHVKKLDISAAQRALTKVSVLRPALIPGPNPFRNFITREGANRLVLDSRVPGSQRLKDWLADDVLTSIEDTGTYSAPGTVIAVEFDATNLNHVVQLAQIAAKQQQELSAAHTVIGELAPKAAQADEHRAADGLMSVGDFANKLKAWASRTHGIKILHKDVWDFLGEIGLIIRGNTIRNNQRTALAAERDFVRMKEGEYTTNHGSLTSASPRLTPAGEGWAWDRAVRRIEEDGGLRKRSVA